MMLGWDSLRRQSYSVYRLARASFRRGRDRSCLTRLATRLNPRYLHVYTVLKAPFAMNCSCCIYCMAGDRYIGNTRNERPTKRCFSSILAALLLLLYPPVLMGLHAVNCCAASQPCSFLVHATSGGPHSLDDFDYSHEKKRQNEWRWQTKYFLTTLCGQLNIGISLGPSSL